MTVSSVNWQQHWSFWSHNADFEFAYYFQVSINTQFSSVTIQNTVFFLSLKFYYITFTYILLASVSFEVFVNNFRSEKSDVQKQCSFFTRSSGFVKPRPHVYIFWCVNDSWLPKERWERRHWLQRLQCNHCGQLNGQRASTGMLSCSDCYSCSLPKI